MMLEWAPRYLVMVVGDFNRSMAEIVALREMGARVLPVGIGSAVVKRQLEAQEVETSSVGRSKRAMPQAASDAIGGCYAALFLDGDWTNAIAAVTDVEQEFAIADGRGMMPLLDQRDVRYKFLKTPGDWAAYVLARAAGMNNERAKEFVKEQRGHKRKDRNAGASRGHRAAPSRRRRSR